MESIVMIIAGQSMGTGFVVDDTGLIVTNCHVLSDSQTVLVKLSFPTPFFELFDNQTADDLVETIGGQVVYCEPELDLSLVRVFVSPEALPALSLSTRDQSPGQPMLAIGNPGLVSSTAVGVVLGTDRPDILTGMSCFTQIMNSYNIDRPQLQHSAPTTVGFSSGPILDRNGSVLGVHFAGLVNSGTAALSSHVIDFITNGKEFERKEEIKQYSMSGKKSLGVVVEQRPGNRFVVSVPPINTRPDVPEPKNLLKTIALSKSMADFYHVFTIGGRRPIITCAIHMLLMGTAFVFYYGSEPILTRHSVFIIITFIVTIGGIFVSNFMANIAAEVCDGQPIMRRHIVNA